MSVCSNAFAIDIDGRIDADEWRDARRITDFRLTEPLSREPATQRTSAYVLATPRGLAIAFRNEQDPGITRTRQRTQRDDSGAVDRVNIYVDFDGDGRAGYNFMVTLAGSIADATMSNENQFNEDWDGNWLHAVGEDEQGWSAEILLPWHIAPMRQAAGDLRTIGLSLDRVIGATGQRMSWPAVSARESRFLSAFEKVEVTSHDQSLFAITPYVVAVHDRAGGRNNGDAGADLFWKPNGRFQLSATLKPDFGQVESDELVVNFSAVETFFSDRRPFFTENQSAFEVPFGSLNGRSRLIYTRRVGGTADDGRGAAEVDAAVKLNGSFGAFNYGLFAASEAGEAGRDFHALRASRDFGPHGLGMMLTRVERPFLDRTADVRELDHRWTPTPAWSVVTTMVGSTIHTGNREVSDSGVQVRADHDIGNGWRQQLYGLHLGKDLQLNDFGYLERNDFNYLRYEIARRRTNLNEASAYASHDWRYAVSRRVSDQGVHIADAAAISRNSQRRDGGFEFAEIATWTAGRDDRITRGHGVVRVPARLYGYYERYQPKRDGGRWSWEASARYAAEGLGGIGEGGLELSFEPTWHASDRLSHFAGVQLAHNPDWLLWRNDNLLGSYRQDLLLLNAGSAWLIDDRQELRIRLEAIGLDATPRQAWRVADDGRPLPAAESLPAIGVRNLGFQIRYRRELAPLSYLYVAYVRGGALYDERLDDLDGRSVGSLFRRAFDLRDSEQLLVKLSYRFGG